VSIKKFGGIFVMIVLLITLMLVITSRIQVSSEVIFGGADSVFINADGLKKPLDGYELNQSSEVQAPTGLIYPQVNISDHVFMLVNADNPIGGYIPSLTYVDGVLFSKTAAKSLEELLAAARKEGYTPYIDCGYRPYSSQLLRYKGKAQQIAYGGRFNLDEALEVAKDYVEYPGCSEHQTGLAVNIADTVHGAYDETHRDVQFYVWLDAHCAEYGFIKRYPQAKSDITGMDEYWHYRYVGTEAAGFIMENGLCLEEFIAHYSN